MQSRYNVFFYVDRRDRKPVEDFIDAQPVADQVAIFRTICLLRALGIGMGMPHTKKLRGSDMLWELRCDRNGRNFRIFYHPMGQSDYLLLHAIVKPERAIRPEDLSIAEGRLTDFVARDSSARVKFA